MTRKVLIVLAIACLLLVGGVSAVTYTINPTYDGRVFFAPTTPQAWAFLHDNTTGTGNSTSLQPSPFIDMGTVSNNLAQITRSAQTWDTSFVLPNDTIDSAKIVLKGYGKSTAASTFDYSLVMVSFSSQSNKTLYYLSDYNKANWGTTPLAPNITFSSFTTTGTNNFTLTNPSSVIVPGGYTQIGYRLSMDVNDRLVNWTSGNNQLLQFAGQGNATQAYRPYMVLDITHYSAPSAIPPLSVSNLVNSTPLYLKVNFQYTIQDSNTTTIMTWKNNVFDGNVTAPTNTINWTGLSPSTSYTLSTKTVNGTSNANASFVNITITTPANPVYPGPMGTLANNNSVLNITTYDGSGQETHPSVVYSAAGWNGYHYLMVMTPYPDANDAYENPSMRYSNDKITWVKLPGQPDPIIPAPTVPATAFLSDPNIVLVGNTLWMFYRYCDNAPATVRYYNYTTSTDGVTWTTPVVTNMNQTHSSSFIYNADLGYWESYGHDTTTGNLTHYTSPDARIWTQSGAITGISIGGGTQWHSDVQLNNGQYQMLMLPQSVKSLYYLNSSDGLAWVGSEFNPVLQNQSASSWDYYLYKSAFVYLNNHWDVWYSGYNGSQQNWHIAYTQYPISGSSPVASFTSNTTAGSAPMIVQFTDTSTNTPNAWNWTFDDGSFSILQNPIHTFAGVGTYHVYLNASNNYGYNVTPAAYSIVVSSVTFSAWSYSNGCWTATNGTYNLTMWNATGTNSWTVPNGVTNITYLVVAGGGGGGGQDRGGGGGAGGLLTGTVTGLSGNVNISVGNGGNGGSSSGGSVGSNGGNSSFANTTVGNGYNAMGGGGGGSYPSSGVNGGSGGGAHRISSGSYGSGVAGQGNNGGRGYNGAADIPGGGGGAGSTPSAPFDSNGANGGLGVASSITGQSLFYAAGGAGSSGSGGIGGSGGSAIGGDGSTYGSISPTGGVNSTGSGGGGGGSGAGAAGGSGIVIIQYQTPVGGASLPVPSFTSNVTSGTAPLAVSFTDSSVLNPTGWQWLATNTTPGNNTAFVFAITQNPVQIFGVGNWKIALNVTNASGYNSTTSNYWINVTNPAPKLPVPSFTTNVTSGTAPTAVSFTDTSVLNPTGWIWTFTNVTPGNNTAKQFSILQNPVQVFGVGNYNIALNVTNASGYNATTNNYWINISAPGTPPVASFTYTPSSGTAPLSVSFTDTSTGSPVSRNWVFRDATGNNTPISFSVIQNPTQIFGVGNYSITLNATNAAGSNVSAQVSWVNVSAVVIPLVSSFTANVTSGYTSLPVQFTDTTTGSPNSWNYTFRNVTGNNTPVIFSTSQNPVQVFGIGNYLISLNTTNSNGYSVSAQTTWINVSGAPPVGGFNRVDLIMEQQFLLTLNIKDIDGNPIPNAQVIDSNGLNTTATFGIYTHSYPYSIVIVYVSAEGYTPASASYVMDSDQTQTITLYKTSTPPTSIQYTTPHDVKFNCRAVTGAPIAGVNVTATYQEASGPLEWIYSWLGILTGSGANVQNTTLFGHTGTDGTVNFLMVASVQYNVTAYKAGVIDQRMFIYPKDDDYTFWSGNGINSSVVFGSTGGYNQLDVIRESVAGNEINATAAFINVTYNDTLNHTNSVVVFVNTSMSIGNKTNETSISNYTYIPAGTSNFTWSTIIRNQRDKSYQVHITSNHRDFGNFTRDFGVTFPPGPISFGLPESLLVYIGMGMLFFVTLCFVRTLPGPTVIFDMFCAWIFYFLGWWRDLGDPVVVVSALVAYSLLAILYNIMLRSKKIIFE